MNFWNKCILGNFGKNASHPVLLRVHACIGVTGHLYYYLRYKTLDNEHLPPMNQHPYLPHPSPYLPPPLGPLLDTRPLTGQFCFVNAHVWRCGEMSGLRLRVQYISYQYTNFNLFIDSNNYSLSTAHDRVSRSPHPHPLLPHPTLLLLAVTSRVDAS